MYDLLLIKLSCYRLSETNVFLIFLAMPLGFQEELPGPGVKPTAPAVERSSLSHWNVRDILDICLHVLPAFTASPTV